MLLQEGEGVRRGCVMSQDEVLHFGQIQRLARGRHGREYFWVSRH